MFRELKSFKFLYGLIVLIFLFLCIYLLVKLFPLYGTFFSFIWKLLTPFIIASFIAYLLYPITEKLIQYNMNKTSAILLIYLLFFVTVTYLIYRLYPAIFQQLKDLNEFIPELTVMYEQMVANIYDSTSFLPEVVHDQIEQMIMTVESALENLLAKLLSSLTKVFDFLFILAIIPVLVFYMLRDFDKLKQLIKNFIPGTYHAQTIKLVRAIDRRLGHYIRGQLLVSLFVASLSFIVFLILDLKYALLLGMIMGITNIIPYFGPIIGSIPVVAITVTVSTKLVIFVIVAIILIQLIENNFLSPYIVGKSINIHPISIIFALLVGGQLGGVLGMILAVPILTIMKEIVIYVIELRVN